MRERRNQYRLAALFPSTMKRDVEEMRRHEIEKRPNKGEKEMQYGEV